MKPDPIATPTALHDALQDLRIHDLIAKIAHVRLKDTLRVLLALPMVTEEYALAPEGVLATPYSPAKPEPAQARACERAYWWLYDNERVAGMLYEIEQLA